MKLSKLSSLIAFLLLFAAVSIAQKDFSNANVEYTFTVPDESWKMTVEPSSVSPNVEFVREYKKQTHFEVRKIKVEETTLFGDMIKDEEAALQFVPGYVAGKDENFSGTLSGRVFNFEYVSSGVAMSGRFYFLRADSTNVYVLRFRGLKDYLRSFRNELDMIARTFKIKKE